MSPHQQSKTILVTGANRGIGYSILQALSTSSPSSRFILAARNPDDGQAALTQLRHNLPPSSASSEELDITVIALDVTDESSISAALASIQQSHGRLDILINNAGTAILETSTTPSNIASSYAATFATNVTGVALVTSAFLPLMKSSSPDPRVINISSARASLHLSTTGDLPPSRCISYGVSKTALNALTVEYAKAEPRVRFYAASPGRCRTAFNGFRGPKDPLDGAKVVVELVMAEGEKYGSGTFWEMEGGDGEARRVPW